MNTVQLLILCSSAILGVCGVASIFVSGWVKATHIAELKGEIDQLWKEISKVNVLESKIESIEEGIKEIKQLVQLLQK
jgi:hypothetical protein